LYLRRNFFKGFQVIGRLRGTLSGKQPPQILVDCAGVGYEVDVPMSTFYALPATGTEVTLVCHQVVREDAHLLFGFATESERTTFRQLLKISGVGPKVALAVLSGMSVDELHAAVRSQDAARLTRVPGIGKKTAERLLLELKGNKALPSAPLNTYASKEASTNNDIANALVALGYSDREISAALKLLPEAVELNDGIRLALKSLAK
jgi:holliday junction DNA helicase RuvA